MLMLAAALALAAFLPGWEGGAREQAAWVLGGLACLLCALFSGGSVRVVASLLCVLALSHARVLEHEARTLGPVWQAQARLLSNNREQTWDPASGQRWSSERGSLVSGEWVMIRGEATPAREARGPASRAEWLPWLARGAQQPSRDWLPDETVRIAPAPGLAGWRAWFARARESAGERLGIIRDPGARALCAALLFGDARGLDPDEEQRFVRSGIYHLMVVSGTQVALLSALFFLPLARLFCANRRVRPFAAWLAGAAVLAYVPLAGGGAPVLRAAFVWVVGALGPRREGLRARIDALSVWAAALCLECLLDPHAPRSLSVQLSYGATLGLIAGTAPLLRAWRELAGEAGIASVDSLGNARAEWFVAACTRIAKLARTAMASSLVATLATLPILCAHFGEFALLGMFATVLCAPIAALLLIEAGTIALFALPLPEACTLVPTRMIQAIAGFFDVLPGSPWCPPDRPAILWALACLLALLAIRRASLAWLRVSLFCWACLLLPWTSTPVRARTVALEVGHGTAVVHQGLDGRVLLFDAGTKDRSGLANRALEPLLAALEAPVDCVILSHSDSDHGNALPWLVERFAPRLYCGPPMPKLPMQKLPASSVRVDIMQEGLLCIGPGCWLVRGGRGEDNEGSRSLLIEGEEGALLLCGDAEESGLTATLRQLQAFPAPLGCVLLPHHGAQAPGLGMLLSQLQPREIWVSAGPRMPLQAELDRRGLSWRWTERDGPLEWPRGSFSD